MSEALAIALMIIAAIAAFSLLVYLDNHRMGHEIEEEARASIEDYYQSEKERDALIKRVLHKYLGEED